MNKKDKAVKSYELLYTIISKHIDKMTKEIIETNDETIISIYPSIALQLYITKLFEVFNPTIATAILVALLNEQTRKLANNFTEKQTGQSFDKFNEVLNQK